MTIAIQEMEYSQDSGVRAALIAVLIGFVSFLVWANFAKLETGVNGIGTIDSENKRQVIQHLEGGIITSLNVREGDPVKAGQVLISVGDAENQARHEQILSEYYANLVRLDRLIAEVKGGNEIQKSAETAQAVPEEMWKKLMIAESLIMENKRNDLEARIDVLNARISRARQVQAGAKLQISEFSKQIETLQDELSMQEVALSSKMGKTSDVNSLKLQLSRSKAERLNHESEVAEADKQIIELENQIKSARSEMRLSATQDMAEMQQNLYLIRDQLRAADDITARTEVRASVDGVVMNLRFHTIGGVVPPGEPIMDIVPHGNRYLVEAKFSDSVVDDLFLGQEVRIHFDSLDPIMHPSIVGSISKIAADATTERSSGASYYTAQVQFDASELDERYRDKLQKGIPVQLYSKENGTHTPMSYFLEPFVRMISRGLRN